MLANFFHLPGRRPPADYEQAFVRDVQVERKLRRDPKLERLLVLGWLLIAVKSAIVWWACTAYALPFHPLWIVLPTVVFATLCTAVYLARR